MDYGENEQVIYEGRPSWRSILAFYIMGFILVLVATGIALAVSGGGLAAGVGAAAFVLLLLIGWLKRLATRYSITDRRLRIKRGILSKRIQQTRIDRVQNVNTQQSVMDRLLRVGTVDFDTAGTDDSDFTFAGVSSPSRVVEAVDHAQHASRGEQPTEQQL